ARSSIPNNPTPVPRAAPSNPTPRSSKGKQWCLPKTGADDNALQRNIDYVCGLGLDCGPIQQHGACFLPNTVRAHAAFAMNLYYQSTGNNDSDCGFDQTGAITNAMENASTDTLCCKSNGSRHGTLNDSVFNFVSFLVSVVSDKETKTGGVV
ncbi:hypothetical protein Gotri_016969, partial [Gossypium trilobum]|nr:hypothetical protein [Gossypium trilobum]